MRDMTDYSKKIADLAQANWDAFGHTFEDASECFEDAAECVTADYDLTSAQRDQAAEAAIKLLGGEWFKQPARSREQQANISARELVRVAHDVQATVAAALQWLDPTMEDYAKPASLSIRIVNASLTR